MWHGPISRSSTIFYLMDGTVRVWCRPHDALETSREPVSIKAFDCSLNVWCLFK